MLELTAVCNTVPGKCKLTVPRNSNDSTRSSILETRKFRVSRFESRASSFESRTSSFESRTSSFETRNKELFARLIFHAIYQTDWKDSINLSCIASNGDGCHLDSIKNTTESEGFHANEVASVVLLFFIGFISFVWLYDQSLKAKFVVKFVTTHRVLLGYFFWSERWEKVLRYTIASTRRRAKHQLSCVVLKQS